MVPMYTSWDRKKSTSVTGSYPSARPRYVPSTAHAMIPSTISIHCTEFGVFSQMHLRRVSFDLLMYESPKYPASVNA